MRHALLVVLLVASCKAAVPEETFTVDPSLHPPPRAPENVAPRYPVAPPLSDALRRAAAPRNGRYDAPPFVPASPSPWIGPTSAVEMQWLSGCTHRIVRKTVAIAIDGVHYPLAHAPDRGEMPKVFDPSELPRTPCAKVTGHPADLAYEGYYGTPVFALVVDAIEDAPCSRH